MNTETPPPPADLPASEARHIIDDDLDLADEKLGTRQEDATRIFVCEGGCE
jgi:hypothetical protein